jgi:uncharacterized protein YecE (DUF72 family)
LPDAETGSLKGVRIMPKPGTIRVGTSGWMYKHWRGPFYPPEFPVKRWFAHYAATFDTVEINNTFYHLPPVETFTAWRRQAPPGFLYALKASRFLTHRKKLKDAAEPLDNILGRARKLGPYLGPILYQLPPRWHCDLERLQDFLSLLPADLTHVFEFRDPSWCNEGVKALLEEAGANYCIHDMRGFTSPDWVTGPIAYVRFHGPTEVKYAGRYERDHLRRWADKLEVFAHSGHSVYAYFNNDAEGHAVANGLELLEMLGADKAVLTQ